MKPIHIIGLVLIIVAAFGAFFLISEETPVAVGELPSYDLKHFESRDQLEQANKELLLSDTLRNGRCLYNWNPTWQVWSHMDCIDAETTMFEATLDNSYLELSRVNLEELYDLADDCTTPKYRWNGYDEIYGDGYRDWACLYTESGTAADWLGRGLTFQEFAYYVDVVKKNPGAVTATQQASADKFEEFIKNDWFKSVYPLTWVEYSVNGEKRGCFGYTTNGKPNCQNHNRVAQDYDMLLYLYDWTGDSLYKDLYIEWTRFFKSAIEIKTDTPHLDEYYTWHYNDDDPETDADYDDCERGADSWMCIGSGEMSGYLNQDLVPIIHGYEMGIGWSKNDMSRLSNTLLLAAGRYEDVYINDVLVAENQFVINEYNGKPSAKDWANVYRGTAMTPTWVRLSVADPAVFEAMEEVYYNEWSYMKDKGTGEYWSSSFYDCVTNSLVDSEKPICQQFGDLNPAHRAMAYANLLLYAK